MSTRTHRIATLAGDGVGPELVELTTTVLDALGAAGGFALEIEAIPCGAALARATGASLPPDALARLPRFDGILKGPAGLPDVRLPDGTEAGLVGGPLRRGLDLYANVRPITLWPGVRSALRDPGAGIDYVIVRENTEGLYAARAGGAISAFAAADTMLITRAGTERAARFAFELALRRSGAPADGLRRVTCIDKANVLSGFALFRAVFDEVAADYPDVRAEHLHADAAAHQLVLAPDRFDVLLTENFTGDLLSDLGAATVGGLGMCPSGNHGDGAAYFEPVHGSAPALAGSGRANPIAQLLAGALLLDHLGEADAAATLRERIADALATGRIALAPDGTLSRASGRDFAARLLEGRAAR